MASTHEALEPKASCYSHIPKINFLSSSNAMTPSVSDNTVRDEKKAALELTTHTLHIFKCYLRIKFEKVIDKTLLLSYNEVFTGE